MEQKIRYFAIICLLLTVLLTSCETLVNNVSPDKLPSLEEKLVVSSFISPQDTLVKVYVSLSSPLFSESKSVNPRMYIFDGDTTYFGDTPFLSDAEVTLKSGATEVKLAYNATDESYFVTPSKSTIEILPNRTYELRVQHRGKVVFAETTVPELPVLNFEVEVDTAFVKQDQFRNNYYLISSKLSLTTPVGGYYRFRGYAEGKSVFTKYISSTEYETIVYDNSPNFYYENSGLINAMSQKDVKTYSVKAETTIGRGSSFVNGKRLEPDKRPVVSAVYNEVMRVTEAYYLYYKSLEDFSGDNPFVEPTPIYSNIKSGLGIFASSNRIGKRVEFK